MASICDFFREILPNDAAKVQAWAAVATSCLATYALFSWKDQKNHDVYLLGLSHYQIHGSLLIDIAVDYITIFNSMVTVGDFNTKIENSFNKSVEKLSKDKFFATIATLQTLPKNDVKFQRLVILYNKYNQVLGDLQLHCHLLRIEVLNSTTLNGDNLLKMSEPLINSAHFAIKEIGDIMLRFNKEIGVTKT